MNNFPKDEENIIKKNEEESCFSSEVMNLLNDDTPENMKKKHVTTIVTDITGQGNVAKGSQNISRGNYVAVSGENHSSFISGSYNENPQMVSSLII